jgi:hypothetical protein
MGSLHREDGDLVVRVLPHSLGHPFGNEKCCSLAYCTPTAPKTQIGRGSQDEGSVGGGVFFLGRTLPASLVIESSRVMPRQNSPSVRLTPGGG